MKATLHQHLDCGIQLDPWGRYGHRPKLRLAVLVTVGEEVQADAAPLYCGQMAETEDYGAHALWWRCEMPVHASERMALDQRVRKDLPYYRRRSISKVAHGIAAQSL